MEFQDVVQRSHDLQAQYASRNQLYDDMEEMFFMESAEANRMTQVMENVKITLSPDARNSLLGAVRLLIATDPIFSMTKDPNDIGDSTDKIEKFARTMWAASGKVNDCPIHYDAVLSGMLYSDVDIAIVSTQDLLSTATGRSAAYKARAEDVAARTPYLFEVRNPRDCFPRWDRLGLAEHYRRVNTNVGEVRGAWGDMAKGLELRRSTDKVTLCEYWDLEYHTVWLDGSSEPILHAPHNLPFIPIVATVAEGSRSLFSRVEWQRQPFLYGLAKSGLWSRQNLALTVMYTMAFAIGANPMFVYRRNQAGKTLNVDFDRPGGLVSIEMGEEYGPLLRQVIDPSIRESLEIATQKGMESTIYRQALGEPLSGNAPYSMVALLSQAGRLPLISPQRKLGWAIGKCMEIAFKWIRAEGGKKRSQYGGQVAELNRKEIPSNIEIDAMLEISMPQDLLQSANIANVLTQGDNPLVSQDWVRKNILKIEQGVDMVKQIWGERAANILASKFFMEQTQRQSMPPVQGMPPSQPSQMMQSQGGLPPEMLAAGGQGPAPLPGQEPMNTMSNL